MKAYDDERDLTHGAREAVQTLYDAETGMVEDFMKDYRNELTTDRLVFIDTFEMEKEYYLPGCGRQPMRMIMNLLPQVLGTEADENAVTCLLSPARLEQEEKIVENHKSGAEVEKALVKFYRNHDGFEFWLQGSEEEEDSITIMGRSI